MRFLIRLMVLVSLAGLAFRMLRMLAFSRRKDASQLPDAQPSAKRRIERIVDAKFTEVTDR